MQTIKDFILSALEEKYLGQTILDICKKKITVKAIAIEEYEKDGYYLIFKGADGEDFDCRHFDGKVPQIIHD